MLGEHLCRRLQIACAPPFRRHVFEIPLGDYIFYVEEEVPLALVEALQTPAGREALEELRQKLEEARGGVVAKTRGGRVVEVEAEPWVDQEAARLLVYVVAARAGWRYDS